MRTGFANGHAHSFAFVTAKIVDDHYVARAERWEEHFFDVKQEALAVDGTIDEPGRVDAVMPQSGEKRHSVPMAIRRLGPETRSDRRPAAQGRHIGLGPGLVDEDEPRRINA